MYCWSGQENLHLRDDVQRARFVYLLIISYKSVFKDTNCTIFDGSSFSDGPNTKVQHMYGAMVTFFDGSPMILGGFKGFGEDQSEVEILKAGANSSWSSMPPMLKPLRSCFSRK